MKITTDLIVGAGLVASLLSSIFCGASSELQTTLASGLIGYMSRGYMEHGGGK